MRNNPTLPTIALTALALLAAGGCTSNRNHNDQPGNQSAAVSGYGADETRANGGANGAINDTTTGTSRDTLQRGSGDEGQPGTMGNDGVLDESTGALTGYPSGAGASNRDSNGGSKSGIGSGKMSGAAPGYMEDRSRDRNRDLSK